MEFLDLKNISERFMELVNPISVEKILEVGERAGLRAGQRVIDFGCGYGEVLALWAEAFGIRGVGIDVRPHACERARRKMQERGLAAQIEIICADASAYSFEPGGFDVAACIGATFIWRNGFAQALTEMQRALRPGGRLIVGEAYWRTSQAPVGYARQTGIHAEGELLQLARSARCDIEHVIHASTADWDRYESSNWRGLLHWLEENPHDPARQEVLDHLHSSQEEYFRYGREFLGWALYLLRPVQY